MKKKCLIAMAVALAMAAMPAVAGAAPSPSYNGGSSSDSDSSSSTTTSTSTGTSTGSGSITTAGVASGTTVVASQPTVQVAANGERVTVAVATKDATGTTIGLVGENAAGGQVVVGNVAVSVATGAAETAGLPENVVNTISALNAPNTALSEALPGLGLEGFSKVGGTRAIIAQELATGNMAAPVEVSLYVDALPDSVSAVTVVCYNNITGQWIVIENVKVDPVTKTVAFTAPGSCTVQIAVK